LQHLVEDAFHGHPGSLTYHPDFEGRDLDEIELSEYDGMRRRPAIWIPHGELASSPGNPTFDTTAGGFGPFAGQIFIGDQTRSNVFRCILDKVDGEYQGGCVEFINHLQSGAVRLAFSPDGSLWAGETSRGWGSVGSAPYGVQQIVYDGQSIPFAIHSISLTPIGFEVTFTQPVADTVALDSCLSDCRHWGYLYSEQYGSPKVDETEITDASLSLSTDRLTLLIQPAELHTGKVYRFQFSESIESQDGSRLANRTVWYTLNRLRPADE